jgi:hypothetical protein
MPNKMSTKEHSSPTPRLAEENARYKDGPFDHIDVPALASFVLCILGLFLFLTWIRSLDGSYFNQGEEANSINRIAHILIPPKMAFVAAPIDQGHPLTPAHSSRPKPAAIDPTAMARISRSRQAVVAHIETIERAPKPGLMSILSAKGNGAKGTAVMGLGSRLKLSGLGNLSSKLQGLQGLSQFTDAQSLRKDIGGDPKTAGIDKTMKGFDNAKLGALAKIGSLDLDKIERVDKGKRYGSARNSQELHAVISRRQTAIRMLYEERLRTRPDLEGKITLLLVIEEDGTVSQVTVLASETNLNDPDLTQQILRVVKRWVFPAFTGGAIELKTPFVLKPQ